MSTIFCASLMYLGGAMNTVALPPGEAIHAGLSNGEPAVCVLAKSDTRTVPDLMMFPRPDLAARRFVIVAPGQNVPDTYAYVASYTGADGFAWTVFEAAEGM